jgi:hypothetical protein
MVAHFLLLQEQTMELKLPIIQFKFRIMEELDQLIALSKLQMQQP